MNAKELSNGLLRTIFTLLGLAMLLYFLFQISSVLIYLIVSLIFTLIVSPLVLFLKRKFKFKNNLAVVFSLFLVLLFIFGFVALFIPLLVSQGKNLSLLEMKTMEQNYQVLITSIHDYLSAYNIDSESFIKDSNLFKPSNLEFIPNFFNGIINFIGNFGMGLAAVFFISFFILKEKAVFVSNFRKLLPENQKEKILNSIVKINEMLSKYFIGLLLQLSVILILYIIVFLIFGVENALIIALLCAILNIVPYLGPIIATVLAAVLIMTSSIGSGADFSTETLPTTFYVVIGMFVVQFIDNNFSSPIIFSKSTNSHPLEIFLVILIAGILFGIVGMIVAVPFYTSIKVIAKEFFPNHKFVKILTKDL